MKKPVARLLAPLALVSLCAVGTATAADAAPATPTSAAAAGQGAVTWTFTGYSSTYGFYGYQSNTGLTTATRGFAGYSFTGSLEQLQWKALHVSTLPE